MKMWRYHVYRASNRRAETHADRVATSAATSARAVVCCCCDAAEQSDRPDRCFMFSATTMRVSTDCHDSCHLHILTFIHNKIFRLRQIIALHRGNANERVCDYFAPFPTGRRRSFAISVYVCMSVCHSVSSHISKTTCSNEMFSRCCLWQWLGHPLTTMQYAFCTSGFVDDIMFIIAMHKRHEKSMYSK